MYINKLYFILLDNYIINYYSQKSQFNFINFLNVFNNISFNLNNNLNVNSFNIIVNNIILISISI